MTREAEQRETLLRVDMENRRDDREAHSGYNVQVRWAPRRQELVDKQRNKLGRAQQGAEGELQ